MTPAGGADPDKTGIDAGGRHLGALREKPVSRVDGVRTGGPGGVDHGADRQVAVTRVGCTDGDRLVGGARVRGFAIDGRADGDGLDAELATGADDAQGDLAAVGDE